MKKISVKTLSLVGLMAALVYVTSAFLTIDIPTLIGSTRLHMGNVMCLLSGLLLGPWYGGLAAGIGSMLFDLTNPAYLTSAPFTLVFKFLMAFVCGCIARMGKEKLWALICGTVTGAITYVILYLGKTFFKDFCVLGYPMEGVLTDLTTKAVTSTVNGVIAAICSVPLFAAIKPLLKKAHLLPEK